MNKTNKKRIGFIIVFFVVFIRKQLIKKQPTGLVPVDRAVVFSL